MSDGKFATQELRRVAFDEGLKIVERVSRGQKLISKRSRLQN